MDVLFLKSVFNSIGDCNCHLITMQKLLKVRVSAGIVHFHYVRRTRNLNLVEPLVIGTRNWSSYFVISKYSHYMQYYMLLLEQCRHIVAKGLATVTLLD